jgi:hypothetical protein
MFFNDGKDFHYKDLGDVSGVTIASKTSRIDLTRSLILGSTFFIILTLLIHPDPLLMLTFDAVSGALL